MSEAEKVVPAEEQVEEKPVVVAEAEKKVEEDLASASASSIDDYLAASKHFAELHKCVMRIEGDDQGHEFV